MSEWLDADGDPLPDMMRLKPDRLRWLVVFLISAGFVAIAIWIGPSDPTLFYGAGGFFVLCALIAAPLMIGVGSSLVLDREGFACRTLFRTFRRTWRECSVFHPVTTGFRQYVGCSTQQDEAAHPRTASVNRALIGASGMLPETYGLSADELSDLMNLFRARALGTSSQNRS
ncbi:MAG: hypothetical protein Q8R82_01975 [Hyphomonadaceae bacterium]|nr:hypothetical protein [Hyphomonadaceae bacterium]